MTSRTYTNNRWFLMAPVALIPVIGPWLAWLVAVKFVAENIIRSPDYDIRRGFFADFIEVTYQKQN